MVVIAKSLQAGFCDVCVCDCGSIVYCCNNFEFPFVLFAVDFMEISKVCAIGYWMMAVYYIGMSVWGWENLTTWINAFIYTTVRIQFSGDARFVFIFVSISSFLLSHLCHTTFCQLKLNQFWDKKKFLFIFFRFGFVFTHLFHVEMHSHS